MADPKPRGRVANFLYRGLDRLVPGNNYNRSTGQWSATPLQWAGAAGGFVGNMVLPGLGTAVRSGVHGYTTGDGALGFLQPNAPTPTSNANDLAAALWAAAQGVKPPQTTNSATRGAAPRQTQTMRAPTPTGMAGLTGIGAQMGGARGAHSQGGITGDAARAWMQAMQNAPLTIDTGIRGPMMQ